LLLFIDNFDSFTYNLIQYFQILGIETVVVRNQILTVEECLDRPFRYLVIGPGPGHPSQAGISKALITACAGKTPILGVCLGHQTIAELYGGEVIRAKEPIHGKTSAIFHTNAGIFYAIPQGFFATRYHSLIVRKDNLPACLEVTAQTAEGEVMGIRHRHLNIEGVQFHPESVLTQHGFTILNNFLDRTFC
jgi:anthranilate synthase/aminodeoxychorismate synthase-like glutamine amidotransferase